MGNIHRAINCGATISMINRIKNFFKSLISPPKKEGLILNAKAEILSNWSFIISGERNPNEPTNNYAAVQFRTSTGQVYVNDHTDSDMSSQTGYVSRATFMNVNDTSDFSDYYIWVTTENFDTFSDTAPEEEKTTRWQPLVDYTFRFRYDPEVHNSSAFNSVCNVYVVYSPFGEPTSVPFGMDFNGRITFNYTEAKTLTVNPNIRDHYYVTSEGKELRPQSSFYISLTELNFAARGQYGADYGNKIVADNTILAGANANRSSATFNEEWQTNENAGVVYCYVKKISGVTTNMSVGSTRINKWFTLPVTGSPYEFTVQGQTNATGSNIEFEIYISTSSPNFTPGTLQAPDESSEYFKLCNATIYSLRHQ